MFVCVYAAHAVHFARMHTLHYRAVAAVVVKLLLVCSDVASMLGNEHSILEMTQERLCRHVLGEDVRGVVGRVDLDDSHQIMLHQLLYEKMFGFDVFGLL